MRTFPFYTVDVFAKEPTKGNPVAVVIVEPECRELKDDEMLAFAKWTNLSETTFLFPTPHDYYLRIFTPGGELPFAGHPTLGSCKAYIEYSQNNDLETIIQRCGIGNVKIRVDKDKGELAFEAPKLLKDGPVEEETIVAACKAMGIDRSKVLDSQWIVNGPEWFALRLSSAEDVLKVRLRSTPESKKMMWGIFGPHEEGFEAKYEVRTFAPSLDVGEDPVTGSFNAGLALWLREQARAQGKEPKDYVAAQGTVIGRKGRVSVTYDGDSIWVGGSVNVTIRGEARI